MNQLVDFMGIIGGIGVIVIGLSKFVGDIWKSRIKEQERRNTEIELLEYKQQLESRRAITDQYNRSQYDVYIEIWKSFQGLKYAIDLLW